MFNWILFIYLVLVCIPGMLIAGRGALRPAPAQGLTPSSSRLAGDLCVRQPFRQVSCPSRQLG